MAPEGSLPNSQVPPPVPNLSELNPVHIPTSHFEVLGTHLHIQSNVSKCDACTTSGPSGVRTRCRLLVAAGYT